jgi:hypothetical protein
MAFPYLQRGETRQALLLNANSLEHDDPMLYVTIGKDSSALKPG